MTKTRLEAFSDGVMAIIITIMVLELHAPAEPTPESLRPMIPAFLSYVLSFVFVGIYWNNHHHLMQAVEHVNGRILWANMHLLFWLSLTPFVTSWMGRSNFASCPVAAYGFVLICDACAYWILVRTLVGHHGRDSALARAIGRDFKGNISIFFYAVAIPMAFVQPMISCGLYVLVAVIWLVPDRRIEKALVDAGRQQRESD